MKPYISSVLVVEGNNDASYISSLYEIEIVVLNGYDCPKEEIDYLKEVSQKKKTLLLTDPDEAGNKIRESLHKTGISFVDLRADISKCNKNGKHGVAECEKEEINRVFAPFVDKKSIILEEITAADISLLRLNKEDREVLCSYYHLGKCNNKKMATRLNSLGIRKEEFMKEAKKYGN